MNCDLLLLSTIFFHALLNSKLYSTGDTKISVVAAVLITDKGHTDAVCLAYFPGITWMRLPDAAGCD